MSTSNRAKWQVFEKLVQLLVLYCFEKLLQHVVLVEKLVLNILFCARRSVLYQDRNELWTSCSVPSAVLSLVLTLDAGDSIWSSFLQYLQQCDTYCQYIFHSKHSSCNLSRYFVLYHCGILSIFTCNRQDSLHRTGARVWRSQAWQSEKRCIRQTCRALAGRMHPQALIEEPEIRQ